MIKSCKGKSDEECRNALVPLFYSTDAVTHTKRFVPLALWAIGLIFTVMIGQPVGDAAYLGNKEPPQEVKFEYGDMDQIYEIGTATKIAIQTGEATSTITVPAAPTQQERAKK
jgi:hypothetical protein